MAYREGSSSKKSVSINIRALPSERDLIDRAAAALGKSRSDFMLELTCREAEKVLLDRCVFSLDEKAYEDFHVALSEPPDDNVRLYNLLSAKSPWEK